MRIKGEYVLREIGGDHILIPIGNTAMEMNGLITMDEVGIEIWKGIENQLSEGEILQDILDKYEVEAEEAERDMKDFIKKLKDADLVE